MSKEINPLTGLPTTETEINPLTGNYMAPTSMIEDYEMRVGSDAYGVTNFANYEGRTPLSPYIDMEETRARNQSTAEAWENGLTKAGVTAAGAFLDNTLGCLLELWVGELN